MESLGRNPQAQRKMGRGRYWRSTTDYPMACRQLVEVVGGEAAIKERPRGRPLGFGDF